MTPVASLGPLSPTDTMKVTVSPTLGLVLFTLLVTNRSACCGVTVEDGTVIVGVGVELIGVGDRGVIHRRRGADDQGAKGQDGGRPDGQASHGPDSGGRVVGPLLGIASTKLRPAGKAS